MKSIIFFLFTLSVTAICFAQSNQTESLTITTYYPAPYGVYRNMRLFPSDEPAGSGVQPGVMYFNKTDNNIYVYRNATLGWQTLGGGSGGNPLVNSLHTQGNCTANNGELVYVGGSAFPICRYNAGGCPSGWNRYNNWSTTVGGQQIPDFGPTACASQACLNTCSGAKVTGHSWANTLPEVWAYHHYIGAIQGSAPQPIGCCRVYALGAYQQGCVSGGSRADGSYFEQLDVSGASASATITQVGCY